MTGTVQIISLSKEDLEDIIRRTAAVTAENLRDGLIKPTPELMTKAELADYLRCDISKVNRFMKKGLPFIVFGTTPRFRKSAIDEWLENERIQEVSR